MAGLFGFKNLADMFNGGGAGYSGDQFMSGGGSKMDANSDGRISSKEYEFDQSKPKANRQAKHDIFSMFSNDVGATPRGSGMYPTGPASLVNNGGILGQLMFPGSRGPVSPNGAYDQNAMWQPNGPDDQPERTLMQLLDQYMTGQRGPMDTINNNMMGQPAPSAAGETPAFQQYLKDKRRSEARFNKPPASMEKIKQLFAARLRGES